MKTRSFIIAAAMTTAVLPSCNRKEQTAGKGGTAILNCVPKHHAVSKNILSGKIYIAYNVSDIPARYDDSANCAMVDGVPTATFTGLREGNYYLAGTGFDTSISQAVKGGLSYTIKQEATLNVDVPVTESH